MKDYEIKIQRLREYFEKRQDVLMAFVFGSYAKGREILESDFDVAIYVRADTKDIEGAMGRKIEDDIWLDISDITEKNVDLVCLNYAPASLVSGVIKTGLPLIVKDEKIYWELYLSKSAETEDFLEFLEDFYRIKQEAKSLNPEEKERLILRFDYLKDEFKEIDRFKSLSWREYLEDKDKRKIIERWAENILNALIDIAKIVLASEKKAMPRSYEDALRDFGFLSGLSEEETKKFSKFADLRNILAHEYLNILYKRIQDFIQQSPPLYKKIYNFLGRYLRNSP